MREIRFVASFIVLFSSTACSIHPLPEDVSPDDTISIVRKIRCEAKEAIEEIFLAVLSQNPSDARAMAVYRHIKFEGGDFTEREAGQLSDEATIRLKPWFDSGFGMTITLTATENNDGSASAKLGLPFTDGALNISLNAGKTLDRKNARTIQITEKWGVVAKQKCSDVELGRSNYLYPITGSVGLAEVIHTYVKLRAGLGGANQQAALSTYSDKLTFTTNLTGGLNPVLDLSPVKNHLKLVNASGKFGASRKDEHDLAIVLTPPKPETDDLEIKIKDNVSIIVKVPKGKYVLPKASRKTGQTTRARRSVLEFVTPPEQQNQLNRALDKQQSLELDKDVRDALEEN